MYNTNVGPGNYTLIINATKSGFPSSISYEVNISVQGRLYPALDSQLGRIYRGDTVNLNSTTYNDTDDAMSVNAAWHINDTFYAAAEDTAFSVASDYPLGPLDINLTVNKTFYDNNYTYVNVNVSSYANTTWLSPSGGIYNYTDNINLTLLCLVSDERSGEALENYTVQFWQNDTLLVTTQTNSTGHANYTWLTIGPANFMLKCNITTDFSRPRHSRNPAEWMA